MTSGRQKKYNPCQASYPHSLFGQQLYDFPIVERAEGRSFPSLPRKWRRLEEILEPDFEPLGEFVDTDSGTRSVLPLGRDASCRTVGAVDRQPDHRCEAGRVDRIAQAADMLLGGADSNPRAEYVGGELGDALHGCGAPRNHDTAIQPARETRSLDLGQHEIENLVHALVDDVRQHFARYVPLALRHRARKLNDVARIHQRLVRAAVSLLQPLGIGLRDTHSLNNVAGNVVSAEVHGAAGPDFFLVKNCYVGGPSTHLDESDSELLLVLRQDRERARQGLEHQLAHPIPRSLHRLAEVHRWGGSDGHQIHLGLEAGADHSDGIANTLILVDGIFLRNRVEKLSILRKRLRAGDFVGTIDVRLGNLLAIHRDDSLADHRPDVLA